MDNRSPPEFNRYVDGNHSGELWAPFCFLMSGFPGGNATARKRR